jgi:hypothetical protein
MIDWNTIIIVGITVFGMLAAFWLGVRLSRGENVLPNMPGKLQVIEPEEAEEKYGEIWPKDRHYPDDEAV